MARIDEKEFWRDSVEMMPNWKDKCVLHGMPCCPLPSPSHAHKLRPGPLRALAALKQQLSSMPRASRLVSRQTCELQRNCLLTLCIKCACC